MRPSGWAAPSSPRRRVSGHRCVQKARRRTEGAEGNQQARQSGLRRNQCCRTPCTWCLVWVFRNREKKNFSRVSRSGPQCALSLQPPQTITPLVRHQGLGHLAAPLCPCPAHRKRLRTSGTPASQLLLIPKAVISSHPFPAKRNRSACPHCKVKHRTSRPCLRPSVSFCCSENHQSLRGPAGSAPPALPLCFLSLSQLSPHSHQFGLRPLYCHRPKALRWLFLLAAWQGSSLGDPNSSACSVQALTWGSGYPPLFRSHPGLRSCRMWLR